MDIKDAIQYLKNARYNNFKFKSKIEVEGIPIEIKRGKNKLSIYYDNQIISNISFTKENSYGMKESFINCFDEIRITKLHNAINKNR